MLLFQCKKVDMCKLSADEVYTCLEDALCSSRQVVLSHYFDTTAKQQAVGFFIQKYRKRIQNIAISSSKESCSVRFRKSRTKRTDSGYQSLESAYDADYYLLDCGGFDIFRSTSGRRLDARLGNMLFMVNAQAGERVLDVGCGRGELAYAMASQGAEVTAVDYSRAAIRIAQKTYAHRDGLRLQYLCKDILTIREQAYQKIVMADVVEHIEEPALEKLMEKCAGLLDQNGMLVIHTAPNKEYYLAEYPEKKRQAQMLELFLPENPRSLYEDLMHINEQTPGTLKKTLQKYFPYSCVWAGGIDEIEQLKENSTVNHIFAVAGIRKETLEKAAARYTAKPERESIRVRFSTPCRCAQGKPGQILSIPLDIRNEGVTLNTYGAYPTRLSYHIVGESGQILVFDGERTLIKVPLSAGDAVVETMKVHLPKELKEGTYTLICTLVCEGCFWFCDIDPSFCSRVTLRVKY